MQQGLRLPLSELGLGPSTPPSPFGHEAPATAATQDDKRLKETHLVLDENEKNNIPVRERDAESPEECFEDSYDVFVDDIMQSMPCDLGTDQPTGDSAGIGILAKPRSSDPVQDVPFSPSIARKKVRFLLDIEHEDSSTTSEITTDDDSSETYEDCGETFLPGYLKGFIMRKTEIFHEVAKVLEFKQRTDDTKVTVWEEVITSPSPIPIKDECSIQDPTLCHGTEPEKIKNTVPDLTKIDEVNGDIRTTYTQKEVSKEESSEGERSHTDKEAERKSQILLMDLESTQSLPADESVTDERNSSADRQTLNSLCNLISKPPPEEDNRDSKKAQDSMVADKVLLELRVSESSEYKTEQHDITQSKEVFGETLRDSDNQRDPRDKETTDLNEPIAAGVKSLAMPPQVEERRSPTPQQLAAAPTDVHGPTAPSAQPYVSSP